MLPQRLALFGGFADQDRQAQYDVAADQAVGIRSVFEGEHVGRVVALPV
ncbi:hypothetical protein CDEF62S_02568 [Castellaniella defragrans]